MNQRAGPLRDLSARSCQTRRGRSSARRQTAPQPIPVLGPVKTPGPVPLSTGRTRRGNHGKPGSGSSRSPLRYRAGRRTPGPLRGCDGIGILRGHGTTCLRCRESGSGPASGDLCHPERGEPGPPFTEGKPHQDAARKEGRNHR